MNLAASFLIVAFGLFLIAFAGVVFAKPTLAKRFVNAFASSARTHYVEQGLRLLIGASLVVLSPAMWQANMFRFVGWAIVISSVVLIFTPWHWHHRFGERIRPMFMRYLRLYAVASFVFGVILLYGVFAGGRAG